MRKALVCGIAIVVWLHGPAIVAAQGQASLIDDSIRAKVGAELFEAGLVNVDVDVQDGSVTLSGTVPTIQERDELVQRTIRIDGVRQVSNEVTIVRPRSDRDLANTVGRTLAASQYLTVFDYVTGSVSDGRVELTGDVTETNKAYEFEQAVSRIRGVQEVLNRIEVLPISRSDDQLRSAVADRIYTDPAFWRYAAQSRPPIHIIVKNARVTLIGVVGSQTDREMAELKVRGVFGVQRVENRLLVND